MQYKHKSKLNTLVLLNKIPRLLDLIHPLQTSSIHGNQLYLFSFTLLNFQYPCAGRNQFEYHSYVINNSLLHYAINNGSDLNVSDLINLNNYKIKMFVLCVFFVVILG